MNIIVNGLGGQHDLNVSASFIQGYESAGGIWNGLILMQADSLSGSLSYAKNNNFKIVIRSTSGMQSYIPLALNFYPDVLTVMPAGTNSYTQIYSGNIPQNILICGAGDENNETGYKIEFFSPDPIQIEPDYSSYSTGYIAGQIAYIMDSVPCGHWEARYRAKQTATPGTSGSLYDGYGLINVNAAINYIGNIIEDPFITGSDNKSINAHLGGFSMKYLTPFVISSSLSVIGTASIGISNNENHIINGNMIINGHSVNIKNDSSSSIGIDISNNKIAHSMESSQITLKAYPSQSNILTLGIAGQNADAMNNVSGKAFIGKYNGDIAISNLTNYSTPIIFNVDNPSLTITGSSNISGALNISGTLNISGPSKFNGDITASNILITNTLIADTFIVNTFTSSSTDIVSGSTKFGNSLSNTHQFTGSVLITGSLNVLNDVQVGGTLSAGIIMGDNYGSTLMMSSNVASNLPFIELTNNLNSGLTTIGPNIALQRSIGTNGILGNQFLIGSLTFNQPLTWNPNIFKTTAKIDSTTVSESAGYGSDLRFYTSYHSTTPNAIQRVVISANGNVGIGNNFGLGLTPTDLLDVRGTTKFGIDASSTHKFIGFAYITGSLIIDSESSDSYHIKLKPWTNGYIEALMALNNGGAGTLIAAPKINDESGPYHLFYNDGINSSALDAWKNSTGINNQFDDIYFTAGNVGIGKNNPTSRLDVNGDTTISGSVYVSGSQYISGSLTLSGLFADITNARDIRLSANNQAGSPNIYLKSYSFTSYWGNGIRIYRARGTQQSPEALQIGDTIGEYSFYSPYPLNPKTGVITARISSTYTEFIANAAGSDLRFGTTPDSNEFGIIDRMIINENGYVGIGTLNPNSLLHVYGTTKFGIDDNTAHTIIGSINLTGSFSQGYNALAIGLKSFANGIDVTAYGEYSHAEGTQTIATGNNSHAEGCVTLALSYASHTEGLFTTASGDGSHAEGEVTLAFGDGSHAEGYRTIASGTYSHAEGSYTLALGLASHAEGRDTLALKNNSHAEGRYATASGNYSHASGIGVIAHSYGEMATGLYNEIYIPQNATNFDIRDKAFVVGTGLNSNSRRDSLVIYKSGIIWLKQSTFMEKNLYITGSLIIDSELTGSYHMKLKPWTTGYSDVYLALNNGGAGTLIAAPKINDESGPYHLFYNDGINSSALDAWKNSTGINNQFDDIYFTAGNVGIGKNNPTSRLDVNGDTTISGSVYVSGSLSVNGVKVYKATITQTGTNPPVATVLENTLGSAVSWSYNGVGQYSVIATGKFTPTKTLAFVQHQTLNALPTTEIRTLEIGRTVSSNSLWIWQKRLVSGSTVPEFVDGIYWASVLIEVYPPTPD